MNPSDADGRPGAEALLRSIFPDAFNGKLLDCVLVVATIIGPDNDDRVVTWFDGSASTALGMAVMAQENILQELMGGEL